MKTIPIIVNEGMESSFRSIDIKLEEIPVEKLQQQVGELLRNVADVFSTTARELGQYELEEFTVSLEISASGKIGILGTGVESEGKGGIQLTFKRAPINH